MSYSRLVLEFIRSGISVSRLLKEMESYERAYAELAEEEDRTYMLACKDALIFKALTGG
jgi:hypothetical protein